MYREQGFTLFELQISLFLLAILLFGLDVTQVLALRETKAVFYFTAANQQVFNMQEYLQFSHGHADDAFMTIWNQQNAALLPQGRGSVQCDYFLCSIIVSWGKKLPLSCEKTNVGQSGCTRLSVTTSRED